MPGSAELNRFCSSGLPLPRQSPPAVSKPRRTCSHLCFKSFHFYLIYQHNLFKFRIQQEPSFTANPKPQNEYGSDNCVVWCTIFPDVKARLSVSGQASTCPRCPAIITNDVGAGLSCPLMHSCKRHICHHQHNIAPLLFAKNICSNVPW